MRLLCSRSVTIIVVRELFSILQLNYYLANITIPDIEPVYALYAIYFRFHFISISFSFHPDHSIIFHKWGLFNEKLR